MMEGPVPMGATAKPNRMSKEVATLDRHAVVCNRSNPDSLPGEAIRLSQAQDHMQWYPKDSPKIYKSGKFYKGFIEEILPPKHIQQQWETQIFERLVGHLVQTTERLSNTIPTLRSEETATEAELCMAGKRSTAFWRTGKEESVGLSPTVWISCGGRKCREKVREEIVRLPYLNHFLSTHHMSAPHVSLGAPRPATSAESTNTELTTPDQNIESVKAVSFHVRSGPIVSGSKVMFTVHTSQGNHEHYSTIGGIIMTESTIFTAERKIFALTTAHGVASEIAYRNAIPKNDTSSDSTHDSESSITDSDSDEAKDPTEITTIQAIEEEEEAIRLRLPFWTVLPFPSILAYLGSGTMMGDWKHPVAAPATSDFALFEVPPYCEKRNFVRTNGSMIRLTGHLPQSELSAGKVHIIADMYRDGIEGDLLDGESCIILKGIIMRTKKIRTAPLPSQGISGAWVVRGNKLCGIVYAAYDNGPYLHMLPAQTVFQDISHMLGGHKVEIYGGTWSPYESSPGVDLSLSVSPTSTIHSSDYGTSPEKSILVAPICVVPLSADRHWVYLMRSSKTQAWTLPCGTLYPQTSNKKNWDPYVIKIVMEEQWGMICEVKRSLDWRAKSERGPKRVTYYEATFTAWGSQPRGATGAWCSFDEARKRLANQPEWLEALSHCNMVHHF